MLHSLELRLTQLVNRLSELDARLADPGVTNDIKTYRTLTKEHAELSPLIARYNDLQQAQQDLATAQELAADPEMKAFAQEEITQAQASIEAAEADIQRMLLPKDPNDDKNLFLEIRAGTGGDESALFAGDLLRMYTRYAERRRWKVEIISESSSDLGGYKEVIVRIEGDGAYAALKFESGGHRVQRVPATETQGRIHTSAATVAVMPEADDVGDVEIRPEDLRIDVFRASGAGGQHVNKTESAVRIVHLPTGIIAECQDDRSQHRNKDKAMQVLRARIKAKLESEAAAKEAAHRKGLVGSGDRSDRIRTYNFPQGRMTDHRINLTLYKLDFIMDGDLSELVQGLQAAHQAEQLAALAESQ
ncbi:MAG: peptide chain release factor 1 [Burkholderiaceae bacterium]